jgi:transposase
MPQPNDLSRSLVALDQNSTIIAVVELSHSSWLVGGIVPGIERQPRKKLEPSPERLLALLHRWRDEAVRAGRTITRIALAFEAGRDGFWLARWLEARGVGAKRPVRSFYLYGIGSLKRGFFASDTEIARMVTGESQYRR